MTIERDELLYSLNSFVAEIGGILGLFLGFSFMVLWDNMFTLGVLLRKIRPYKYFR